MNNNPHFLDKEYPLISVIVPVFNVEKYIERCINSILQQSYENLEIILIDDGSTDRSGEICDKYAIYDSRIKVIHQKNQGLSEARNSGLKVSTGNYVTFVDSDDYLLCEKAYREALTVMENEKVDIVAWLWQYMDRKDKFLIDKKNIPLFFEGRKKTCEFAKGLYYGNYANGLVVSVWNKLYKKEFICGELFEGRIVEDEEWSAKILSKKGMIYCIRKMFYVYVQNEMSLTNTGFKKERLRLLNILKNRVELFKENSFIVDESKKLFLELYIEYYYKAKKSKISTYKDKRTFLFFEISLLKNSKICFKDVIRYTIFWCSPKLYKSLINRRK